jgi:hypothetical protein
MPDKIKIPQNVEREDRIIGPLTVRQFLYALATAALLFAWYQMWANWQIATFAMIVLMGLTGILGALFIFFQFNGKDFAGFLGIWFKFLLNPKKYVWQKTNEFLKTPSPISQGEIRQLDKKTAKEKQLAEKKRSRLERLSNILQGGGKIETDQNIASRDIGNLQDKPQDTIEPTAPIEDILEETDK